MPEGRARWTIILIVEESIKRGIVDEVGRETIRVLLKNHELKPWREKNVVRPTAGRALRGADGRRTRHARATAERQSQSSQACGVIIRVIAAEPRAVAGIPEPAARGARVRPEKLVPQGLSQRPCSAPSCSSPC